MLELIVPVSPEGWDEIKEEFVEPKVVTLQLEHSLLSLSKWETIWHKPFLNKEQKTKDELRSYIKCMTINKVDDSVYYHITNKNLEDLNTYLNDPATATTLGNPKKKGSSSGRFVTSELIYYWMTAFNIPFSCETWNLTRLITLIRVCEEENEPKKKMKPNEVMKNNAALNAARRKKLHSKG